MTAGETILLIDAVHQELFVALVGAREVFVRTCGLQREHDRNLNRLTEDLIDKASAFAVVIGYGSWTGSRVGVAAVKAYAVAENKPVIALLATENREDLIAEVRRKFDAKEFTSAQRLAPVYDSEFKITPPKKPHI
jgi:tRNA A37 threonylcarbamoyladenosine modification protein TsaB